MHTLKHLRNGQLAGSRRLNLSCDLNYFPPEIFDLADTLEILDLSGNALNSLPDELPRLHKLRILFCSNNLFTELPRVLGQCTNLSMVGFKTNSIRSVPAASLPPNLRWLILTDNQISELPAALGNCTQLQKLMLAGNRLSALPEEMTACTRLELLRIAANRFEILPDWLGKLPRLAWLAYAGNPCCAALENITAQDSSIHPIDWRELEVQQQLGEGASGVIYQALWHSHPQQTVAVKLFKGKLTSDGLPQSEMACCIKAGEHPNLISVRGRIQQHPGAANGLVMTLVAPEFRNLAKPPSLDSCTRDIYAHDTQFSAQQVLSIATGIAAAVMQLHARGILHGDLYAHNILYNSTGHALLGDFGAASLFDPEQTVAANALQRLEVRAFAYLLDELLTRCGDAASISGALTELQVHCVSDNPAERPLFAEIVEVLQHVSSQLSSTLIIPVHPDQPREFD
ncbi:MAG: leucine-rich repeat-containing protein kinase family protein [Gallionellaceae bacterium]|jgi:hypothetical protein